jgi:DNA-binding beta-propeller fold protein YncE
MNRAREKMKRMLVLVLIVSLTLVVGSQAQDKSPLKLLQTIPLSGLKDGDFDHFAADLDGHRLFLTAEKNKSAQVFDLNTNKLIHTITELDEPHAILYRNDSKKIFIVDGGASEVKVFDGDSYALIGQIKLSVDADSIAYDPTTKLMYVVNGGREAKTPYSLISVVDTDKSKKLRDIKIDSNWVEAIVPEKSGPRMFCNATGKNSVLVLDRTKSSVLANWPLPAGVKQNVAMAYDESDRRLFVTTRNPAKLIVLSSDDGKVVASAPIVDLVDDLAYDPQQKRIYFAGDGFIEVFEQKDADHYVLLAKVPGSFRAKTAILIPKLNRYYLAVPRHDNHEAEVRVYEVQK